MWKSYLVSNFKKASENAFMIIEFEPLWEGKRLTDGQWAVFHMFPNKIKLSKAITESMWTRRIVALDNRGVKPPMLTTVSHLLLSDLHPNQPPGLQEQHLQQKRGNAAEDRRIPAQLPHAARHKRSVCS